MNSEPAYSFSVSRDIQVPMEDGVVLVADHYAPNGEGPFPTILIRSFWGRGWKRAPFSLLYMYIARRFARVGFHVILQDLHQRTAGLEEHPMPHIWEVSDGRDTLIWLAKQPWFDGRLGLWGASYLGFAAWAAAAGHYQDPVPGVDALSLYAATTAADWYQVFHESGAFALDTALRLQYLLALIGKPFHIVTMRLLRQEQTIRKAANIIPIFCAGSALPQVVGFDFEALIRHTDPKADFWQQVRIDIDAWAFDLPVHLIAGWFDIFLKAQLADYERLVGLGAAPHLTIGPWHHTDSNLGVRTIRDGIDWFNATLKGTGDVLGSEPVRLWLLGADKWVELGEWPPITDLETRYLSPPDGLAVQSSDEDERTSSFRYDPADPTPSVGGAALHSRPGMRIQFKIEEREDVLVFSSESLKAGLDVIGEGRVYLYASGTTQSWDIVVRLCDVDLEGRSTNVSEGIFRHTVLGSSSEPIQVELWPTAYHFKPGHRIRLHIAGAAHPRWGRVLGSEVWNTEVEKMRVCEYTLFHDSQHPSRLELPIFHFRD